MEVSSAGIFLFFSIYLSYSIQPTIGSAFRIFTFCALKGTFLFFFAPYLITTTSFKALSLSFNLIWFAARLVRKVALVVSKPTELIATDAIESCNEKLK